MIADGIYAAEKIFTGTTWLHNHAIVVQDETIHDVKPLSEILVPVTQQYNCLIPACIDLQIYGANKKLFSVFPTTETLQNIYDYCLNGKAAYFLPTIATNTYEVMYACIDAVKTYWQQGGKGCLGLHIEGPWISVDKRGAHVESLIHTPTLQQVQDLLNYGKGIIKMITLAPEVCTNEILALIKSYSIIISAGHSNANFETANGFLNNTNITAVTHLYNAMSGLQHRSPGLVGACLLNKRIKASIIPDGHHVHYAAIQIAYTMMQERLFVITDAVTTTIVGPYQHELVGNKYETNQTLSGSALTMQLAIKNLVQYCAIDLEEAINMCSYYPAQVLGLENTLGKIEKGYTSAFVSWEEE